MTEKEREETIEDLEHEVNANLRTLREWPAPPAAEDDQAVDECVNEMLLARIDRKTT